MNRLLLIVAALALVGCRFPAPGNPAPLDPLEARGVAAIQPEGLRAENRADAIDAALEAARAEVRYRLDEIEFRPGDSVLECMTRNRAIWSQIMRLIAETEPESLDIEDETVTVRLVVDKVRLRDLCLQGSAARLD